MAALLLDVHRDRSSRSEPFTELDIFPELAGAVEQPARAAADVAADIRDFFCLMGAES